MNELQRPLIPQFSIRWILAATAVLALASLVGSQALRGKAWAGGIIAALAMLVAALLVYALLFVVALLVARAAGFWRSRQKKRQTPAPRPTFPVGPSTTAIAFFLLILALPPASIRGATGNIYYYPILGPQQTNKTGLTLTIDTSWVEACGYRPVTVEFQSTTGPLTADRVLKIQLRAETWYSGNFIVTQIVEIPAGSASAKAIISVPQRSSWKSFEWTVSENGQYLEQLCSRGQSFLGGSSSYTGDGAPPSMLVLSGLGQISANHLTIFGQTEEMVLFVGWKGPATPSPQGVAIGAAAGFATGGIASLADLPTRWIDYSSIDMVLTSLDQLKVLVNQHPAQWKAIQSWLSAGGSLIVYGVGNQWEQLDEVPLLTKASEQLTTVATQPASAGEIEMGLPKSQRGWIWPAEAIRDSTLNGVTTSSQAATPPEENTSPPAGTAPPKKFDELEFVTRPYGDGMLAAIRSDDHFKSDNFPWTWLYNTLGSERWQWFQRYGVSLTRENRDFWNFLIPGVGAAPVTMFQVLITLFVLIIGPVNYYLLRRAGKLNMLVFSVPLCATVITGGLLIYSLVADGLQVRLRGRSFTQINQRSGESACWARLSYYAGLPPSGGLTFSDQTIVLPLLHHYDNSRSKMAETIDWQRINPSDINSPLKQHFVDGPLKSRTPTQFVTVRIHQTEAKLMVKQTAAELPPKVENKLGVDIEQLVLVAANGKCFTATGLAAGQSTALTAWESQNAAATKLIEPLMNANDLQMQSIDFDYGTSFGIGRYRNYYYYNSNSSTDAQQSTGIMERSLLGLREKLRQNQLPSESYVAIVKNSPEMETGTPAAQEEASFHVVFGQW